MFALDDMAHVIAGDIGLEESFDGRNVLGFFRLDVRHELGEFLLKQFVL